MAALAASRHNPVIAEFYKHLVARDKKAKAAILASLRKMLAMLNAMIRDNAEWPGMPREITH